MSHFPEIHRPRCQAKREGGYQCRLEPDHEGACEYWGWHPERQRCLDDSALDPETDMAGRHNL